MVTTNRNLTYDEFKTLCRTEMQSMVKPAPEYFERHRVRLFETYTEGSALIAPNSKVMSVGAGSAYIEIQLRKLFKAQVTVVDFQGAVDSMYAPDYNNYGFQMVGLDLATDWQLPAPDVFDLILSLEVLEHLTVSPAQHLKSLAQYLKPGGHIVLTTPNFASLHKLLLLLKGQPVMPNPNIFFAPISLKNRGIHRREYVESEFLSAIAEVGLKHIHTKYIFNREEDYPTLRSRIRMPLFALNNRFKPTMLFVAQK